MEEFSDLHGDGLIATHEYYPCILSDYKDIGTSFAYKVSKSHQFAQIVSKSHFKHIVHRCLKKSEYQFEENYCDYPYFADFLVKTPEGQNAVI